MQKATRPGWFEREDWVPIHWADMEWCRGICLKIHISFIFVFCTLHIYLNKFTSTYYVCIYYWFISGILPFIFKTWLSEKAKNDKIRHLATCVVATLQDRYQTSTTSVFWCKIFITHHCQNVHLRFQTAAVGNGHQLLCGPNVILVLKNRKTAWQMPQAAAPPQFVIILCIYLGKFV